jgi:hypothetical protein
MPPRKNNPLPTAMRLFNCTICDKGYPRQLDYENHLRSYDHNHRQRLADMKKITAQNDPDSAKPKQGQEMRSINVEEAGKKMGAGGRFTKIGGGMAGRGFKKVGVSVGGEKKSEEGTVEEKKSQGDLKGEEKAVAPVAALATKVEEKVDEKKDEDTVMADEDDDAVTWEEYDFTKPTGCDHASCGGCKTDGIWSGEWIAI